jgi:signal transduction histidine kinase
MTKYSQNPKRKGEIRSGQASLQIGISSAILRPSLRNTRIQFILVIVLMLASSVPILGFGLLETFRWRTVSTEMAKERVLSQSVALQNEVQRIINYRLSAFEMLAEQMRLQSRTGGLQASKFYPLMKFYSENFGLISVGLTDMKGLMLEYYSPLPGARARFIGRNVLRNGFVEMISKYRTPIVTPLKKGQTRNLFFIAIPVWSYDKTKIVGAVGGSVLPTEIQKIADHVMVNSPLLQYLIVDSTGTLITGTGMSNDTEPLRSIQSKLYSPVEGNGPEIRQGKNEKGEEVFAAVQRVALHNSHWTIVVSESMSELLKNERASWQHMLLIVAGALVLSFVLATLISYLISKPIIRLINCMQMIKQGDFKQWSELSEKRGIGFKEIHAAWHALIGMAKQLHDHAENLEKLVQERTQELDVQRARSIESARLASLGEMAGGIAHEINNPLSIISMVAEQQQVLLKQGRADQSRIQAGFKTIEDTTHRIVKIIQGMRTFSRDGQKDPLENIELKGLLESTLNFCQQKFLHHQIELVVSVEPDDLMIKGRSVQLSQVILNLLSNAFDAVEAAPERWIKVAAREIRGGVEIRVVDSGPGVPEQYRDKIFQPFFTLKEIGKGTGLGLSISRSIVESQSGTLELDVNSERTSFVIRMPAVRSPGSVS